MPSVILQIFYKKYYMLQKLPWLKVLLLVLYLRSAFFGEHKLSYFEIITGRPMYLVLSAFNFLLIKGDEEIKTPQLTTRKFLDLIPLPSQQKI